MFAMAAMLYSEGIVVKFEGHIEGVIRKKRREFSCDSFENSQNRPIV